MAKPPEKETPLEDSRRFAKGEGGRQLVLKCREYAFVGDYGGFLETLAKLKIYPGSERYEAAVRGYHAFCRELGLPEPP